MKQTVKVACCGVISALTVVIMLGTNIPIMLFAVPALAGIFYLIPAIEIGTGWGILCYIVTAVLSLILPTEAEALTVFIGFLGYYPILKMLIERLGKRIFEYILKFAAFNVAIVLSYVVIIEIIGINPFSNGVLGLWATALILLAAGNVAFAIYDYALTMIIKLYFIKFRKHIRKAMGLKGRY